MKVLFNSIYYLLILGLIGIGLLLLSTMMPIAGGLKIKIVKSGSMEPAIMTGSIVVIRGESSYAVGDVITFGADTKVQIPTTHRIVAVSDSSNPIYTTKGDANDAADPADTHLSDIHGKVIATVPYLGYLLDFARKPIGFGLLVGVPSAMIILEEVGKIIKEIKRLRQKKNGSYETQQLTTGGQSDS